jgi:hypothetical protein
VFCVIARKAAKSHHDTPRTPDLTSLAFFWEFVKDVVYREKIVKYERCMTESSELQSASPMKWLPVPGEKLNIVLICVVPLMVAILRATEHNTKFCELQCLKI